LASYGPEGSLTSTKPFFRDKRSDIKYVEAKKIRKKRNLFFSLQMQEMAIDTEDFPFNRKR
jgi:hypothetical protein